MRKALLLALCVLAFASLAAGCGKKAPPRAPAGSANATPYAAEGLNKSDLPYLYVKAAGDVVK